MKHSHHLHQVDSILALYERRSSFSNDAMIDMLIAQKLEAPAAPADSAGDAASDAARENAPPPPAFSTNVGSPPDYFNRDVGIVSVSVKILKVWDINERTQTVKIKVKTGMVYQDCRLLSRFRQDALKLTYYSALSSNASNFFGRFS